MVILHYYAHLYTLPVNFTQLIAAFYSALPTCDHVPHVLVEVEIEV